MLLGSLLVGGAGRWIVPFPVFLVLLEIKIRIEERLMLAEFPDDYPRYRQRVPQLVPGLKLECERLVRFPDRHDITCAAGPRQYLPVPGSDCDAEHPQFRDGRPNELSSKE